MAKDFDTLVNIHAGNLAGLASGSEDEAALTWPRFREEAREHVERILGALNISKEQATALMSGRAAIREL